MDARLATMERLFQALGDVTRLRILGLLLTGAVLTETVFAYPGLGEALYIAFTKKDFPVIQLVILAAAAAFVIINTLVDLAYALVDPRIRAR